MADFDESSEDELTLANIRTKERKRRNELRKLVAIRNSVRDSASSIISELDGLCKGATRSADDIDDKITLLNQREEELIELDQKIRALIENIDDLTKEVADARKVRDDITLARLTARRKRQREPSPTANNRASGSGSVSGCNTGLCSVGRKSGTKLPRLEMPKFDGDITLFNSFWSRFKAAVDDDEALPKVEKFNYLVSYLVGDAKSAVSSYNASEEAYDQIVKLLKDRFGRSDLIMLTHMKKLANLQPVESSNDVKALRRLLDICEVNLRGLKGLGMDTASKNTCLCPSILQSIPEEIRLEYSRSRVSDDDWNAETLVEFLRKEVECRERSNVIGAPSTSKKIDKVLTERKKPEFGYKGHHKDYNRKGNRAAVASAAALSTQVAKHSNFCIFCNKEGHVSVRCENYPVEKKREIIRKSGRCFNCLRFGHNGMNCPSDLRVCQLCKGRHNKAVCHLNPANSKTPKSSRKNEEDGTRGGNNTRKSFPASVGKESATDETRSKGVQSVYCDRSVLLKTAQAVARNPLHLGPSKGKRVRCLLDDGSEATFIREDVSRALNLPVLGVMTLKIKNFGNDNPEAVKRRRVRLTLENKNDPSKVVEIVAIEVPYLCQAITTINCKEIERHMNSKGLTLADEPEESARSGSDIGILIGSDYYWEMANGNIERIGKSLVAQETKFGWVLQGPHTVSDFNVSSCEVVSMRVGVEDKTISDTLKSFWELESLGIDTKQDVQHQSEEIMRTFEDCVRFQGTRYQVKLPFITEKTALPNNLSVAIKRMKGLIQRFQRNPAYFQEYKAIINEQLQNGIVEKVETIEAMPGTYYLPHQGVVREASATTKLRIVFDASSHVRGAPSLNNCLSCGPNLNPDLMLMLLRFRKHKIAITADIEKAFLQVEMAPEDRNSLRFLWVKEEDNKINPTEFEQLRMTRVPFWVTSSPFLLAATIKTHLKNYDSSKGEIIALGRDLYVDDLVSGTDNVQSAFELSSDMNIVMNEAGMRLRKWNTNDKLLRKMWGLNDHARKGVTFDGGLNESDLKILGLLWKPTEDYFTFDLSKLISFLKEVKKNKRFVLSAVGQIFDPIGILSPYTIRAKFLFQSLWELGLGWDEDLPQDIGGEFGQWCQELPNLRGINLPRCYFQETEEVVEQELHCFCDSSTRAYACVIYIRYITTKKNIAVSLVTAKARVAPLKRLSLPRLELMACLLGSRLLKNIRGVFQADELKVYMWTDSMIALHWVKGSAKAWKPFVSNRVSEIQKISDPISWSHCPGTDNPADLPTRGVSAVDLIKKEIWWHGPTWLKRDESYWPDQPRMTVREEETEVERRKTVLRIECEKNINIQSLVNLERYSRLDTVLRVTAYLYRFIDNCRKVTTRQGALTASEMKHAENKWIIAIQLDDYENEIRAITNKTGISKTSKILTLNPFINDEGILCVGGRLSKSDLTFDEKHPAIVSKGQRLAQLLIWRSHDDVFHSGTQATFTQLRSRYWIPAGRQLVKSLLKKCYLCKRFSCKAGELPTAPLPKERIEITPPFQVVGIDFAGPLYIKTNQTNEKAYICLFTCAVTRALHLELVTSLSTEEFLLAFRRMIGRRGLPSDIYTDNGKTFVKANSDLKLIWEKLDQPEVKNFFGKKGINWRFIADRGAWWGGFWERMVKTTKNILKKALGHSACGFQELQTILIEVEAIINSRPITYDHADVNEPNPLTPSHLLIGKRITGLPSQKVNVKDFATSTQKETAKRMRYRLALMDRLNKRWKNEYLLDLRSAHHSKLAKNEAYMKKGDVVLVHDDKIQKQMWKMGIVTETQLGRDGKVRACIVRTPNGNHIRRPVQLLYPLEISR